MSKIWPPGFHFSFLAAIIVSFCANFVADPLGGEGGTSERAVSQLLIGRIFACAHPLIEALLTVEPQD